MTSTAGKSENVRNNGAKLARVFFMLALGIVALGMAHVPSEANDRLPRIAGLATATGEAKAPYGWVDFCRRNPQECAVSASEPDRVRLDERVWRMIQTVNRQVNAEIQPITDMDHWGVIERWDIPTDGMGDCEDYVLLKRQRLTQAGLPARALRATVVVDAAGEGHAVLMLRTDRGDYILDNKRDSILPWGQTGYMFIKRERQESFGWTSLGGAVSPSETAAR